MVETNAETNAGGQYVQSTPTPSTGPAVAEIAVSLETIVDEMFAGSRMSYTLKNGRTVNFHTAVFKQIATVTRLFQNLCNNIPREQFIDLIATMAHEQIKAMAAGKGINDINLNTTELVEKAFGQQSIVLTLFASCMDFLPEAMPNFCDITEDEFNHLEIEDAIMVCLGVIGMNYGFFTQSLPRLFKTVIGGWSKKNAAASTVASLYAPATSTAK